MIHHVYCMWQVYTQCLCADAPCSVYKQSISQSTFMSLEAQPIKMGLRVKKNYTIQIKKVIDLYAAIN